MTEGKYEIIDIAEIVEGDELFVGRGYSIVKTTRRVLDESGDPTGASETVGIRLPIKSSGAQEYIDALSKIAPKPPTITVDGAEIGKKSGELYRVFDVTDEKYLEALDQHMQDVTFKVVAFALDVPIRDADGGDVKTIDEKEKILKRLNLTSHQVEEIADDIRRLTMITDERADFLSARRSG